MRTWDVKLEHTDKSGKNMRYRRVGLAMLGIAVAAGAIFFARDSLDSSRLRITSPQELSAYFDDIGYTAKTLQSGNLEVPRFFVSGVPRNWSEGLTVDRKKSLFFRALLPMVLMVNDEIMSDRQFLLETRDALTSGTSLSRSNVSRVEDLSAQYRLSTATTAPDLSTINNLLRRVDTVPPSLALAQAAVESAYGSSRFAVEGNALFGQWRYGKGLTPKNQRSELGDYRIANFETPKDSIRAYMRNLNTNAAYRSFRDLRAAARTQGERPRGAPLAAGLLAYSEKGQEYISLLRSLIARNGLSATDSASLKDHAPKRIVTGPL